ncbi:GNAT family N-acetyltransferase [Nocardioides sp. HDW12B]|uniref:GNAT family N-acetyltransferase n=1 Tax=Nocardioides sp. HDW12B TaxID=2714939 RepID=UPI0014084144|nr:GNAT family N-acetyltransferase [Nocardioides sp. HDW12B]QIK65215.1 GNAT family N-acetyltransferase [Nocardioides sp. HDW12B]
MERVTVVRRQEELGRAELVEVRALLDDAFADDPLSEDDWQHCQGGRHVLTREDGRLVAYAAVVERVMLLDGVPLAVGYVEGVGVRRSHHRRGLGGTVMAPIEALAGGDLAALALSTSDEGLPFYLARGWRPWPGRTYVDTSAAPHRRPQLLRTPDEDESLLVWPHGPFADVGPDSELACRARSGDDW